MCKPHGRERGEGGVDGGWREVVGGWEPPGRRGKGCLPCRQDSWPPEGSSMHLLHLNTSRCHGKWIDSLKPSKSIFTSFVLYHKAYLCRWYRAWQTLDPQKYGSMEFISLQMKGRAFKETLSLTVSICLRLMFTTPSVMEACRHSYTRGLI